MPCYHPLKGWKARSGGITFNRRESPRGTLMTVPCGQCIGCRLERSRQWATRIMHEASRYDANSFLTLTYAEDPISLRKDDLQKFFKRARKAGFFLRYYACGEYGDELGRPHFHVCLFGEDFADDRYAWAIRNSFQYWRSPALEALWPMGHSEIGSLTFESAAYVARYVTKKITEPSGGLVAEDGLMPHYTRMDEATGELHFVKPEFALMSRGGRSGKGKACGIGAAFFDEFHPEITRDDSVIVRGREAKPPRYYDCLFQRQDPDGFEALKAQRRALAERHAWNSTDDRLAVREAVCKARFSQQRRSYEARSDGSF